MQISNCGSATGGGSTLIGTRAAKASASRRGTTARRSELATIMGSTCNPGTRSATLRLTRWPCQKAVNDRMRHSRRVGNGVLGCFERLERHSGAEFRMARTYDTHIAFLKHQPLKKPGGEVVEKS